MYNESVINRDIYFQDLFILIEKLENVKIDAIVAIKRSGFIMGTVLSNALETPLYTTSEIDNIPDKFKNILLVDDKICTGKTIKKYFNRFLNSNKNVITASIYIEKNYYSDYWIKETNKTCSMWYEKIK